MTETRPAAPESPRDGCHPDDAASLRGFLRGYLHQDCSAEYGTPANAAARFRAEADPSAVAGALRAWLTLRNEAGGRLDEFNTRLAGLGCEVLFRTPAEVEEVAALWSRPLA